VDLNSKITLLRKTEHELQEAKGRNRKLAIENSQFKRQVKWLQGQL
jgi:hypothetical protein